MSEESKGIAGILAPRSPKCDKYPTHSETYPVPPLPLVPHHIMSIMAHMIPLFRAWAVIGAIKLCRHIRSSEKAIANAMIAGTPAQPWG